MTERRERRDYLQARIPPFWFESPLSVRRSHGRCERHRTVPTAPRARSRGWVCAPASPPAPPASCFVLTEPGELSPGDILVAPITDPAWTPLFLAAAGVVVDVGAQQSHAAIVSRELGIPAVVSATGASTTIPDGARRDRRRVDGARHDSRRRSVSRQCDL